MKDKLQNIRRNVRSLRKVRCWTQEELANRAGISRIALIHIESGKALPTLETLASLSGQLDVSLEELFSHDSMGQDQSQLLSHAGSLIQSGKFTQMATTSPRHRGSNLALAASPKTHSQTFQELVQQLSPTERQAIQDLMAALVDSR